METMCGIPRVRLEGNLQDWLDLRTRTQQLAEWMLPEHAEGWINAVVVPILDEFVKSYQGNVDHCFWQNMVKFRETGGGSGDSSFLSGWLPTLFPYLNEEEPNTDLRHWTVTTQGDMRGPKPSQIPLVVNSVSVLWDYFGTEYPMHFHAGFTGVSQESDGTVKPHIGWYVTDDPEE